jgi:hypothetical protein
MLKYLQTTKRRNGVYQLEVNPDMVIPLTNRGLVARMELYIAEACQFSWDMGNQRVSFSYLNATVQVTGKTDPALALAYWIRQLRLSALQGCRNWPVFMRTAQWFETVVALHKDDTKASLRCATDTALMLSYFMTKEPRRSVEQVLDRYWVLLTDRVPIETLEEALTIHDCCWLENGIGGRIVTWWERREHYLPALFGLKRSGKQMLVVTKAQK